MSDSISLQKPLNDSIVNGSDFTLLWSDSGHASTCIVEIADDLEFSNVIFSETVTNATKLRVRETFGASGEVCFWRVTSVKDDHRYASNVSAFETWTASHTHDFQAGADPESVTAGVEPEHLDVSGIATVVGSTVVFLVFTVAMVMSWANLEFDRSKMEAAIDNDNPVIQSALIEAEKNILQYGTTATDGIYRIPIDQAINVIVSETNETAPSNTTDLLYLLP